MKEKEDTRMEVEGKKPERKEIRGKKERGEEKEI